MFALGITGGVGTGKSCFTQQLASLLNAGIFDADLCARELLAANHEVRAAIREAFGEEVFSNDNLPNRNKIRDVVFQNSEKRRALEQILHPRIRQEWLSQLEKRKARNAESWWLAEIPLLYETEAQSYFDQVIVVASDPKTQAQRLIGNRGLTPEMASRIIAAQLPLTAKISRADFVIWNSGSVEQLQAQSKLCAAYLKSRYGRSKPTGTES